MYANGRKFLEIKREVKCLEGFSHIVCTKVKCFDLQKFTV